ncbi:hypothetical protein DCF83_18160 (plasmid) [Edwardsiella tarda]|uniref:hypothetical protein n=1 Tax=Edwardsiella tarda TaxID=636 RepID=UPI0011B24FA1|nr:hypothetical protein [Edwardsiella tarda]UCQ29594.1 hypothetical protein DCF83_18160 [Edwardsiella tarda]
MFDTKIEKKEFNVPSFSPSNLRIVKDRKNRYFVFQLECITSIEPFWDDKHKECDVITSFGERTRVCMTVDELYAELIAPYDANS